MFNVRRSAVILLGTLFVLSTAAWGQGEPKKLTVAEAGRLFLYLPLYYAVERGFFTREGLDVNVLTAGRRDLAMKAVLSDEAFASVHDPIEAALARSRGADVKIIAPVVYAAANWLVADEDITEDPKTWQGKTIALSTPPTTQYSIFVEQVTKDGWKQVDRTTYQLKNDADPSHYLKVLFGAFGSDLSLMMTGKANMALMLEPGVSSLVIREHKHIIKNYPALIGPFLLSTINISEKTIKNDRPTVQKFVNALTRAYEEAYNHPDQLEAVAAKWFPNSDPNVTRSAVKNMIDARSFAPSTKFIESAYRKNLQYFAAGQPDSPALKVTFADIADTSFADQASAK